MGYFPNGSAGDDYEGRVCAKCAHYADGGCPVLDIHRMYNYDQFPEHEKTADAKRMATALRFILRMLIPVTKDGLGNERCKMFLAQQDERST